VAELILCNIAKPVVPPQLFQSRMRKAFLIFQLFIYDKAFISHHKMIVTTCCGYSLTWEPPTCPTCLFSIPNGFRKLSSVNRSQRRSKSTFPSELAPAFGSLLVVTLILVSLIAGQFYSIFKKSHTRGSYIKSTRQGCEKSTEKGGGGM